MNPAISQSGNPRSWRDGPNPRVQESENLQSHGYGRVHPTPRPRWLTHLAGQMPDGVVEWRTALPIYRGTIRLSPPDRRPPLTHVALFQGLGCAMPSPQDEAKL
jgi:hypothetical protein